MSEAAAHTSTTPASSKPTVAEIADSLTGYDEDAIQQHMGVDIYDGLVTKFVLTRRLLVFVHQTRLGATPADAVKTAKSMPSGEVVAYFGSDPEEVDDEEPETPAGKELSIDDSAPESSPSGAS